ncbi:MAG: M28 family metallopeptidase [Candidatus Polarisedimenticolia bacterium]
MSRHRSLRMNDRSAAGVRAAAALFVVIATGAAGLSAEGGAPAPRTRPRLGFTAVGRAAQQEAEAAFLAVPAPDRARAWLRALTEEPHVAGTPQGRKSAEYVRDRLREFGLKADLNTYEVLLNHPKSVALRLVEPHAEELSLREEGFARDKDSFSPDAFPGFHGYGASGKARAQVIYANYGTREDFERLEASGLPVAGRIVLVRYGRVFRGLKVKEAQDRRAAGVVIYSDPADDGFMKGDVYPDGPMRPPSALQRGSVRFLSYSPGDPTTPGWASTKGARRLPQAGLEGIPRIPSLPLSYGEAAKILKVLQGERVPDDWQGGLPFAYHFGPGPAALEMNVEMDYAVRPIDNVIATIPGGAEADQEVVLGNHRDAWTYGAVDPNSGTAAFLETARGLAAALRAGWKPRRTIVLASWDGEEYALLGSTEWVEDRLAALQKNAVAYVNLDSAVTGPDLDAGGVPSLRDLLLEVAGDLDEPKAGGTLLDAWRGRLQRVWARGEPAVPERAAERFEPHLGALGSGSDFTAFLDHAGVPSLDFTFEGGYGVYHSIYDDFFWMEKFGDPEFLYHAVAARLYGLLAMRLASAEVVPFRFAPYGRALRRELDLMRQRAIRERRIWEASRAGPIAPRTGSAEGLEAKKGPAIVPDLADLERAVGAFADAGAALDAVLVRLEESPRTAGETGAADAARRRLNQALVQVERSFLDPQGLPGRPWFRHAIYAPGLTTGYEAWVFPGVAQGIKDRDPALAAAQEKTVAARLAAATAALQTARQAAEAVPRGGS